MSRGLLRRAAWLAIVHGTAMSHRYVVTTIHISRLMCKHVKVYRGWVFGGRTEIKTKRPNPGPLSQRCGRLCKKPGSSEHECPLVWNSCEHARVVSASPEVMVWPLSSPGSYLTTIVTFPTIKDRRSLDRRGAPKIPVEVNPRRAPSPLANDKDEDGDGMLQITGFVDDQRES